MSEQQKQPPSVPPCQGGSAGSLRDKANGVAGQPTPAKGKSRVEQLIEEAVRR